jgi:hypothetical protein
LLNLQNKNLLAKYEDARDKISKLSQKISEIENSNEYKDVVAAQYSKDDISYTEIIEKISEIDSQIRLSKDALSVLGGSDIELVTDTKELLKLKKEYFSSSLELVKNNPLWQDYYSSYSLLEK